MESLPSSGPVTGSQQTVLSPTCAADVGDVVKWALAGNQPLELRGSGSRLGFGQPTGIAHCLDLSQLSGIIAYEPEELVLTALAGTPMAEILAALQDRRQHLAFELPDPAVLWGDSAGNGQNDKVRGTLGGVVATALAGSRRISAGSVRDHVLGYQGVNGRGELYKAGAAVVKNVTGYDLPKLMTGSMGTLTALTEITIKVLPAPEDCATLLLFGLDDQAAITALTDGLKSPHEVSGAAHLPAELAASAAVGQVTAVGGSVTALRLEGFVPSVAARLTALKEHFPEAVTLETDASRQFWREVTNVAPFAATGPYGHRRVWRLSVPPASASRLLASLRSDMSFAHYLDWGGGLLWLAPDGALDVRQEAMQIRRSLTSVAGSGHATLMRADVADRSAIPVFQPQSPALAALSHRVARNFDPQGLFNPGRMVADHPNSAEI